MNVQWWGLWNEFYNEMGHWIKKNKQQLSERLIWDIGSALFAKEDASLNV